MIAKIFFTEAMLYLCKDEKNKAYGIFLKRAITEKCKRSQYMLGVANQHWWGYTEDDPTPNTDGVYSSDPFTLKRAAF